jgi:esterase/lipase superfamily enzyme
MTPMQCFSSRHRGPKSNSVKARKARRKPGPALICFVTTLAFAGCAARPVGFLTPVAGTVPGASKVEMVIATTRERAEVPGEMFSGYRSRVPAFADIVVSIPPNNSRTIGEVQWPQQLPGNPATDFVTLRAEKIDRDEAIATFARLIKKSPSRQAVVFVHGFNNRFDDAVFRFAQIIHDSDTDAAPVLFTWPSKGSVLAYGYDRESAGYSRDSLENLLRWLSKNPDVSSVAILAHSMGNWVTLEALRQMAIRDGRVAPKIKTVLLAAPDVDVDVSREQIIGMGPNRPHFILFTSTNDQALLLSRNLWGAPRLGGIDPTMEPFKSDLEREGIDVVNLSGVASPDQLGHGTYAESAKVVELIGRRIAAGQTLEDQRVGFGERVTLAVTGAATAVGSAAGLAVSAPLAIVDPETGKHYGDHIDAFGRHLGSAGQ